MNPSTFAGSSIAVVSLYYSTTPAASAGADDDELASVRGFNEIFSFSFSVKGKYGINNDAVNVCGRCVNNSSNSNNICI